MTDERIRELSEKAAHAGLTAGEAAEAFREIENLKARLAQEIAEHRNLLLRLRHAETPPRPVLR